MNAMNRSQPQRLTIVYEVHSIGHREALLHSTSSNVSSFDGDAISQRDELLEALKWTITMDADQDEDGWEERVHAVIAKATGTAK